MAGIQLRDNKNWIVAGWVFRTIAKGLLAKLPNELLVSSELSTALESGLEFAELNQMPESEYPLFEEKLIELYVETSNKGPTGFASQEFYDSFLNQFRNLLDLLNLKHQ